MNKRLPSIGSLIAFEAAARLKSITRAADEVGITQAAASIRLKGLEEHLGFPLFLRENGQVRLSAAGARYQTIVQEIIGSLIDAARSAQSPISAVRLTVFNAFAQHWLLPRFNRLTADLGTVEVKLIIPDENDLGPYDNTDLSIQLAEREEPGAIKLIDDELIAVCRPDYQAKFRLHHPVDLLRGRLLHEGGQDALHTGGTDCGAWIRKVGIDANRLSNPIGFYTASLLVDAALHRIGVALVRRSLVADEIAEGLLVTPFRYSVPCKKAVYLVRGATIERNANVSKLRDWLLAEVRPADVSDAPANLRQFASAGLKAKAPVIRTV
ncbi:MAG TPA: LysR family transcriptional regulator [Aliidongia sp.]|uniref:LysR family transcriptional regulator n=1 Tax=Aliidongia sp. TaxID=1914230 RepID=UPI002DDD117A|nr:LysR family transcriptional regulator [Aliidongia sp.]HEV2674768.1 LysR family transcriptional regulator [Aliidongia sp.]